MSVYWLGLLTDTGAEPPASAGYGRVALDLPDTGTYANPEPVIFCKARFAWPVLTHAGLFTDASLGVAFMTTPLAPPPYSVPTPIAVDETEEAVVPTGWLRFEFIAAGTPRPYGRFRYGRLAYSRWPDGAVVQFRTGARLLADKIDVNCQAWAPAPTWLGRVCS